MYSYSHILIPMVCIAGSSFIHSILCRKKIYPNLCPSSKKNSNIFILIKNKDI